MKNYFFSINLNFLNNIDYKNIKTHLILILFLMCGCLTFSQNYSFNREAHKAKWVVTILNDTTPSANVTKNLNFNAPADSRTGQQVANSWRLLTEEGVRDGQVIIARPYVFRNSSVKGTFKKITHLPKDARLKGKYGFGGLKQNDGFEHRFLIYINYYVGGIHRKEKLFDSVKKFDGSLGTFDIDLSRFTGKVVSFELEIINVSGNGNYNITIWKDVEIIGDFNTGGELKNKTFFIKPLTGNFFAEIIKPWETFAGLQIDSLTKDKSQRFTFKDAGEGYYYIQSSYGTVLSIDLNNLDTGKIFFTELSGLEHQKWRVLAPNGTYHSIQSKLGNFIEVTNYKINEVKTPIRVWLGRLGYQNWKLIPVN